MRRTQEQSFEVHNQKETFMNNNAPTPPNQGAGGWFTWLVMWFFRIVIAVPVILSIPFRECERFLRTRVYDKKHPIRRRVAGALVGMLLGAGVSYHYGLSPGASYAGWGELWWYAIGLVLAVGSYFYLFPAVFGVMEVVYELVKPYLANILEAIVNFLRTCLTTILRQLGRFLRWASNLFVRAMKRLLRFVNWVFDNWADILKTAYTAESQVIVLHLVNLAVVAAGIAGGVWFSLQLGQAWLVATAIAGVVLAGFVAYLLLGAILLLVRNWFVGLVASAGAGYAVYLKTLELLGFEFALGAAIVAGLLALLLAYPVVCTLFIKALELVRLATPLQNLLVSAYDKAWKLVKRIWNKLWDLADRAWKQFVRFMNWVGDLLHRAWKQFARLMNWIGDKWEYLLKEAYRSESQVLVLHLVNLGVALAVLVAGTYFSLSLSISWLSYACIAGTLLAGLASYLIGGSVLLLLRNRFVGFAFAAAGGYFAYVKTQAILGSYWDVGASILGAIAVYTLAYPLVCLALVKALELVRLALPLQNFLTTAHNKAWELTEKAWNKLCAFAKRVWDKFWDLAERAWKQIQRFVNWVCNLWLDAYETTYRSESQVLFLHLVNVACAVGVLAAGCYFSVSLGSSWLCYAGLVGSVVAGALSYLLFGSTLLALKNRVVGIGLSIVGGYFTYPLLLTFGNEWAGVGSVVSGLLVYLLAYPVVCATGLKLLTALGAANGLQNLLVSAHDKAWNLAERAWKQFVRFLNWVVDLVERGLKQVARFFRWVGRQIRRAWKQFVRFLNWVVDLAERGLKQVARFINWVGNQWAHVYKTAYMSDAQGVILHLANVLATLAVLTGGVWFSLTLSAAWLVVLAVAGTLLAGLVTYLVLLSVLVVASNRLVGLVVSVAGGYALYLQLSVFGPEWSIVASAVAGLLSYSLVYPVLCTLFLKALGALSLTESLRNSLESAYNKTSELVEKAWHKLCDLVERGWKQFVRFLNWVGDKWRFVLDTAYASEEQAIIVHLVNIAGAVGVAAVGVSYSLSLTTGWLLAGCIAASVLAGFAAYLLVGALLLAASNALTGLALSGGLAYVTYLYASAAGISWEVVAAAAVGVGNFVLVYPVLCTLFLKGLELVRLSSGLLNALNTAYRKAWNLVETIGRKLVDFVEWTLKQVRRFFKWIAENWYHILETTYGSPKQAIVLHLVNIVIAVGVVAAGIVYSLTLGPVWLVACAIAGSLLAGFVSYLVLGALLLAIGNWLVGLAVSGATGFAVCALTGADFDDVLVTIGAVMTGLGTLVLVYPLLCVQFLKALAYFGVEETLQLALQSWYDGARDLVKRFADKVVELFNKALNQFVRFMRWVGRVANKLWNRFCDFLEFLVRQFKRFLQWARSVFVRLKAKVIDLAWRFWNFVKPAFRVFINAYDVTYHSEAQGLILHLVNIAIAVALFSFGLIFSLQQASPLWLGLSIVATVIASSVAYLGLGAAFLRMRNRTVGGALALTAGYVAGLQLLPSGIVWAAGAALLAGAATYLLVYPVLCGSFIGILSLIGLAGWLQSLLLAVHQWLWNKAAGLRGLVSEIYVGTRDWAARTAKEVSDWIYGLWRGGSGGGNAPDDEERPDRKLP